MPYSTKGSHATELWAAIDMEGNILYSRGGSSTAPKLLVYPSRARADAAIRNPWIRQKIMDEQVVIKRIYKAKGANNV